MGNTLAGFFEGPGMPSDDTVQPVSNPGPGAPSPQAVPAPKPEPTPTPEPEPEPSTKETETPERPDDEPLDENDDEPAPKSLHEAMDQGVEEARLAAEEEEKAAAKAKKDEEAAKVEAEKKAEEPDRDSDLKHDFAPHTHERTRKVITKFQSLAKTARDERDQERAKFNTEIQELQAKLAETEKKASAVTTPKAVEEELKSLRERVRELDISKDPQLEAKYDKRIAANADVIVDILKGHGLGLTRDKDGKEVSDPAIVQAFVKKGITAETIYPMIVRLRKGAAKYEEGGQESEAIAATRAADELQGLLRENDSIAREKQREIDSWKGDYDRRKQEREQQSKAELERREQAFITETDRLLKAEVSELAKEYPSLKTPPSPLPTDPPAVAKAKQLAIDNYNAATAKVQEVVNSFATSKTPPERIHEAVGRLNANAIQGVMLKLHVLPEVKRELTALTARNKELEKELAAIRGAGSLSRRQSAPSGESAYNGRPEPKDMYEALGN